MTRSQRVVAIAAGLAIAMSSAIAGQDAHAPGRIAIYLHSDDNRLRTPVNAVSLTDKGFYICVSAVARSIGPHEIRIAMYDSSGREVFHGLRGEEFTTAGVSYTWGYYFQKGDPMGTWQIVTTLDDEPLADLQLVIF